MWVATRPLCYAWTIASVTAFGVRASQQWNPPYTKYSHERLPRKHPQTSLSRPSPDLSRFCRNVHGTTFRYMVRSTEGRFLCMNIVHIPRSRDAALGTEREDTKTSRSKEKQVHLELRSLAPASATEASSGSASSTAESTSSRSTSTATESTSATAETTTSEATSSTSTGTTFGLRTRIKCRQFAAYL